MFYNYVAIGAEYVAIYDSSKAITQIVTASNMYMPTSSVYLYAAN